MASRDHGKPPYGKLPETNSRAVQMVAYKKAKAIRPFPRGLIFLKNQAVIPAARADEIETVVLRAMSGIGPR